MAQSDSMSMTIGTVGDGHGIDSNSGELCCFFLRRNKRDCGF